MPEPLRILVFEDSDADFSALLDALHAKTGPDVAFQITWFKAGFRPPSGPEFQNKLPYPVRVAKNDRPMVIDVDARGRRQAVGSFETWQYQFDAAVLDVVHQPSSTEVGYWFADWLGYANFAGPVFLLSKNPVHTSRRGLADLRRDSKEAKDWVERISNDLAQPHPRNLKRMNVDFRGRPPQRLIADFCERGRPENVRRSIAYLGADPVLGAELADFFHMRLIGGSAQIPIAGLETAIHAARDEGLPSPSVVLVDCGPEGCVTDELLYEIDRADDGLAGTPTWLILADRDAITDRRAYDRMNAAVVNREAITSRRSVWAFDTIQLLRKSYEGFKSAIPFKMEALSDDQRWSDDVVTAGNELLKSLLPALAMARAMDRLVSEAPTLVSWIAPGASSTLNSSFNSIPRKIAKRLNKQGRVSDRQLALFSPHGN
jgi:hypothetical protein